MVPRAIQIPLLPHPLLHIQILTPVLQLIWKKLLMTFRFKSFYSFIFKATVFNCRFLYFTKFGLVIILNKIEIHEKIPVTCLASLSFLPSMFLHKIILQNMSIRLLEQEAMVTHTREQFCRTVWCN